MKRRISLYLSIMVLCAALSGCGAELPAAPVDSGSTSSVPTNVNPLRICAESDDEAALGPVFAAFEKEYDISVEVSWIPPQFIMEGQPPLKSNAEERNAYLSKLRAEIQAGSGPDVFAMQASNSCVDVFGDIKKAMRSGVFADLVPLITQEHNNIHSINEKLLTAGMVSDAMYFVPLSYQTDGVLLCDTPEKNKALAEELKGKTTIEYLDILDKAYPDSRISGMFFKNLVNSSSPPMDYDASTVDLSQSDIPRLANREIELAAHAATNIEPSIAEYFKRGALCNSPDGLGLISGQMASGKVLGYLDWAAKSLNGGQGSIFVPYPNAHGQNFAFITSFAAISAGSKQTQNAIKLIDYMLSEKWQEEGNKSFTTAMWGLPARGGRVKAIYEKEVPSGTTPPLTKLEGDTLASFVSGGEDIDGSYLLISIPREPFKLIHDSIKSGKLINGEDIISVNSALQRYLSE